MASINADREIELKLVYYGPALCGKTTNLQQIHSMLKPEFRGKLMSLENVLLIPHLASATTETRTAMADLAVSNAIAVLNGQPPITAVP